MVATLLALLVLLADPALADPWDDVAAAAQMPTADVRTLVEGVATKQTSVLDRMATPWEARPWYRYFPIFLTEEREQKGVAFWRANEATLDRVAARTGVPPEYVVAILGVETRYGEVMGDDGVLDALYTLGFFHPKRGPFFRAELGNYLRLAVDEGWPLAERRGSYAGAMGMAQFMPSSYRHYAVDGDGDGHRDLFGSPADAIASVAHYFEAHGWRAGEPVLLEATAPDGGIDDLVGTELKPTSPWSALAARGITTPDPPPGDAPARLYAYDLEEGVEYRVGLTNFYVVTRYNHSKLYARVVHELALRLRAAHDAG